MKDDMLEEPLSMTRAALDMDSETVGGTAANLRVAAGDVAREREESSHTNRIEALRAASRIVATSNPNKMEGPVATTILAAEQFTRWLETGER